jgi:SAM-dependent methyltransferase
MTDEVITVELIEWLRSDFAGELSVASAAVDAIRPLVAGRVLKALSERSPALRNFDWDRYLTCSIARMVHVLAALRRHNVHGRVLDYGSYFGNFSLMLRQAGFDVDAVDSYLAYGESLSSCADLLRASGVRVLDSSEVGRDLSGLADSSYDAVLFLGVLEHIPNSPRDTLESIRRVLTDGGCFVLDTPNQAYLPNRQRLARGESIMASIDAQFSSRGTFEGHHREYTADEVLWMLDQIGQVNASLELFNYSQYGLSSLEGRNLSNHWSMVHDPSQRELIMALSFKPADGKARTKIPVDWKTAFYESETHWLASGSHNASSPDDARFVAAEGLIGDLNHRIRDLDKTIVQLQEEVNRRDDMLRRQEQHSQEEIRRRDQLLAELSSHSAFEVERRHRVLANLNAEWKGRVMSKISRGLRALLHR